MSATFVACNAVETESRKILAPFIQEHVDDGHIVFTAKGNMSKFLQEIAGDAFVNKNGRFLTLELKAEETDRPNLFLETWSNRNCENAVSHAERGSNPGWLIKNRADWLFYHFLETNKLCIANLFSLQRWAFGHDWEKGRIYDFPEKPRAKRVQFNDTWGRCVPIEVLQAELCPKLQVLFLRKETT